MMDGMLDMALGDISFARDPSEPGQGRSQGGSQGRSSFGKSQGRTDRGRQDRAARSSPYARQSGRGGKGGAGGRDGRRGTGTSVYVGNLSWDVAWQDLKDHFKSCGDVLHADVMTEASGRSKGCGIVTFASARDAQTAIDTLHDTEIDGRLIFVREDREAGSAERNSGDGNRGFGVGGGGGGGCNVYVGNLPWDVEWQDLKDMMKVRLLLIDSETND